MHVPLSMHEALAAATAEANGAVRGAQRRCTLPSFLQTCRIQASCERAEQACSNVALPVLVQVPLSVKEALAAATAEAHGGGAGGEGSTEALRFPLALGPPRVEAGVQLCLAYHSHAAFASAATYFTDLGLPHA